MSASRNFGSAAHNSRVVPVSLATTLELAVRHRDPASPRPSDEESVRKRNFLQLGFLSRQRATGLFLVARGSLTQHRITILHPQRDITRFPGHQKANTITRCRSWDFSLPLVVLHHPAHLPFSAADDAELPSASHPKHRVSDSATISSCQRAK